MTAIRTKSNELRFQDLFDNLFSPEVNVLNRNELGVLGLNFAKPKLNIKEYKDGYYLELATPGFNMEDFTVNLDQNVLTVSSKKKEDYNKGFKYYKRLEFPCPSFDSKFNLLEGVELAQITADYLNGVLAIHIPKVEEVKHQPPKIIEVR